jgi:hypothetical protein
VACGTHRAARMPSKLRRLRSLPPSICGLWQLVGSSRPGGGAEEGFEDDWVGVTGHDRNDASQAGRCETTLAIRMLRLKGDANCWRSRKRALHARRNQERPLLTNDTCRIMVRHAAIQTMEGLGEIVLHFRRTVLPAIYAVVAAVSG